MTVTYRDGDGIQKNEVDAVANFRYAALKGDEYAQYHLACIYLLSEGAYRLPHQAVFWLEKAAEKGMTDAEYLLGVIYSNGNVVGKDYDKAISWYRKASDKNHLQAVTDLGSFYYEGIGGLSKDYTEAAVLFRKAAEGGNIYAQSYLGLMYERGEGFPKNRNSAISWYEKAAKKGYSLAQYNLSVIYYEEKKLEEAFIWAALASEQGAPDAKALLSAIETQMSAAEVDKSKKKAYEFWQRVKAPSQ